MQFSKTSRLESGESSEKSSGENRVKSCHVCGCHGFFGPDLCLFPGVCRLRRKGERILGNFEVFLANIPKKGQGKEGQGGSKDSGRH